MLVAWLPWNYHAPTSCFQLRKSARIGLSGRKVLVYLYGSTVGYRCRGTSTRVPVVRPGHRQWARTMVSGATIGIGCPMPMPIFLRKLPIPSSVETSYAPLIFKNEKRTVPPSIPTMQLYSLDSLLDSLDSLDYLKWPDDADVLFVISLQKKISCCIYF